MSVWLFVPGATRLPVTIADRGTSRLAALDTFNFNLMIVEVFMPHMRGFDSIRLFHQLAQRDRRMLVGSRAAPKISSHPVCGHERSVRAAARRECKRWDEGGGVRAMNEQQGRSASGGGHAANSRR